MTKQLRNKQAPSAPMQGLTWLLAFFLTQLLACSTPEPVAGPEPPADQAITAKIDFRLVDKPNPEVAALDIEARALRLRPCDGGAWISLDFPDLEVNLLDLVDGVFAPLVEDGDLSPGTWCEPRLVAAPQATLTSEDGTSYPVDLPSAGTSGLKIKGRFEVIPGDVSTIVTIDFDVDKSLKLKGNGRWKLDPVLEIKGVEHVSLSDDPLPPGEYEGWTVFTAQPGVNEIFELTGGATIEFFPGSVTEPTEFVVTRWSGIPGALSDLYRFSDHPAFAVAPYLRIPSLSNSANAAVWLDQEILLTHHTGGFAGASIPHFSDTHVESACEYQEGEEPDKNAGDPKEAGDWCNGMGDALVTCDGAGGIEEPHKDCPCYRVGTLNDRCAEDVDYLWDHAPWETGTCMLVTQGPVPETGTHSGVYAIDVQTPGSCTTQPDLVCPFDRCRVSTECRSDNDNDPFGQDVCVLELDDDGEPTGRWEFVAHLDELYVENGEAEQGDALGRMGNTGNIIPGDGECQGYHFHVEQGTSQTPATTMLDDDNAQTFPFGLPAIDELICATRLATDSQPEPEPEPPQDPLPNNCDPVVFDDIDPEDGVGGEAAEALGSVCALQGNEGSCPTHQDSQTMSPICPPEAFEGKAYPYPGKVACGRCLATRAEFLGFGLQALVEKNYLDDEIRECSTDISQPCNDWTLCCEAEDVECEGEEANDNPLTVGDWRSDYIGWSIAPERSYFLGDGTPESDEPRTCRPDDGIIWIEALTILARMTDLESHDLLESEIVLNEEARQRLEQIHEQFEDLSQSLSPGLFGCALNGVEDGGEWWIPATVAMHNAGIYCMPFQDDELRTANVCETESTADCRPTRYMMAIVSARLRGLIPADNCGQIDIQDYTCG